MKLSHSERARGTKPCPACGEPVMRCRMPTHLVEDCEAVADARRSDREEWSA